MPHNGVGAVPLDRAETGLGASVWELQPGASQFVYRFHHGSDELLVVLRGAPTVRMHDGERAPWIVDGEHHYHRTGDAVEHAGPE